MKNIILVLFCLVSLNTLAQTTPENFDAPSWKPPYFLPLEGWTIERFQIPIPFAPEIHYMGVEDLRFTTGWGNSQSDEYWTYAFLWYLDGKPKTNAKIVAHNLKAYYTGLIGSNIESRKIPADKTFPVKTKIKKIKTDKGDLKTFRGTIYMLDYMDLKPIVLNCIVHLRSCPGQNNTFIFNEISPKPFDNAIWQRLNKLWTDFNCTPTEEPK